MFPHRLILGLRKPLHYCLTSYSTTGRNKIYIKYFHISNARRYCISENEKNIVSQLRSFANVRDKAEYINKPETISTHQQNHIKNKHASSHRTKNHNYESLKKVPIQTIHNVYQNVASVLNSGEQLNVKISQGKDWTAEYIVKWPQCITFSGSSKSKIEAKRVAAAKCLDWLIENNYLINGKPKIFDKKEVENKMLTDVRLNIKPKYIEEMKSLINTYNEDIETKIKESMEEKDEDTDLKETTATDEGTEDFLINPFSGKQLFFGANYKKMIQSELSRKIIQYNQDLPIYKLRKDILSALHKNQVLVIKGDTGCGKTTQVPQFIFDEAIKNNEGDECAMLVVQPRRISAVSLGKRIARERREEIGRTIGYEVRLNRITPSLPCGILYCTTGILLRKIKINPNLDGFSHIIIDEAHERNIEIDMILALLKEVLQKNPSLKVIIMSATIKADIFQEYFNCPLIQVEGRMYPVNIHFYDDLVNIIPQINKSNLDDPMPHYNNIVRIIEYICNKKPDGGILCFLPGWEDLIQMRNILEKRIKNKVIYLTHSRLSQDDQHKIFAEQSPGIRKIVLATNIAETGITVNDIRYVVDCAIQKSRVWDEDMTVNSIRNEYVSKANIKQRRGRAGRVQPGESYHCLWKKQYDLLQEYPDPEIHTSALENSVLLSKSLTDKKASEFFNEMLEPPTPHAVQTAIRNLINLGALDDDENLTPLGKRLIQFTVHPVFSKAMVYSAVFQCVDPVITIATVFSTQHDIFKNALTETDTIKDLKKRYHPFSDHLAVNDIYTEWKLNQDEITLDNSTLFHKNLEFMDRIRELYLEDMVKTGIISPFSTFKMNTYIDCDEIILGIIYLASNQLLKKKLDFKTGQYEQRTLQTKDGARALIMNCSVNHKQKDWPSPFCTHFESRKNCETRIRTIRETSIISPLTVFFFTKTDWLIEDHSNGTDVLLKESEGGTITLLCDKETAAVLTQFHKSLWSVIDYMIAKQGITNCDTFNSIEQYGATLIDVLSNLLTNAYEKSEEERMT